MRHRNVHSLMDKDVNMQAIYLCRAAFINIDQVDFWHRLVKISVVACGM